MRHFDLVVIGTGPAGQKAAIQAAKLGKQVAVVEKKEEKPFWKFWTDKGQPKKVQPVAGAVQETGQQAEAETPAQKKVMTETAGQSVEKPAEGAVALPTPEQNPEVQVVEKKAEKPFWKFWQK